jgi:alkylation response protein AidB-like acyl-CoA dehydrogenase
MSRALTAHTEAGAGMVALAEEHSADFATRADRHDRDNTFVLENFDAMKASGFLAATAPARFGGMGVECLHDMTVAISRLARGCPSTAIAVNMHLGFTFDMSRTWRHAVADGDASTERQLTTLLRLLGRSRIVMTHAGTEPGGASLYAPATQARKVDGGYVVNGHKVFATNSPAGDVVTVFLQLVDGEGERRLGMALVRRGSEGMEILDNWDALGMRGSGSNGILLTDCFVPEGMMQVGARVGEPTVDAWPGLLSVNYPLVAAYLGIAEAAHAFAVDIARTKRKPPFDQLLAERPAVQFQFAEMEVELATARALLGRTSDAIDECLARPNASLSMDDVSAVVLEFQCTKLAVNKAATSVVDRAMTVIGGGAYLTGHPLARLYRDVRAGGFMQPYSATDAMEFIGRVSLGLDPFVDVRTLRDDGGPGQRPGPP